MFARVTVLEIDTVRISVDAILERFKGLVLPVLKKQPGYRGIYALVTPEGKGMLMSLWESEEAARAGIEGGFYDEQMAQFITLVRQPPGRDHYEVVYAEEPGMVRS